MSNDVCLSFTNGSSSRMPLYLLSKNNCTIMIPIAINKMLLQQTAKYIRKSRDKIIFRLLS